jgi:hypothetical protein
MEKPPFSVADVIRLHGPAFVAAQGASLTKAQHVTLIKIAACRTILLGGHVYRCDTCGEERIAYNSCRDRHCPSCLAHRSADWLRARMKELLPVPYFHVVFTVPESVAELALGNKRIVYGILFRAAAATLIEVARNPKRLGAKIGFLSVLHTWSQTLVHHPHVHCVIPGGGLSDDETSWISSRPKFFLPVRVLSRVFRGKFTHALRRAAQRGKLHFNGATAHLADHERFDAWLRSLKKVDWVVYSKRPFGSPQRVLKYLAAYTHRVAISNRRILSVDDRNVTFKYRDRKAGSPRTMTLAGPEFLRRFLLHLLPRGFTRIRYFGFMANRVRKKNLARCREILGEIEIDDSDLEPTYDTDELAESHPCPACSIGQLVPILEIPRPTHLPTTLPRIQLPLFNTS